MYIAGDIFFFNLYNFGTYKFVFLFLVIPDVFYTKHNKSYLKIERLSDGQKNYRKDWMSMCYVRCVGHFLPLKTPHNFIYFGFSKVHKYFYFNREPLHLIMKKKLQKILCFHSFIGHAVCTWGGTFRSRPRTKIVFKN